MIEDPVFILTDDMVDQGAAVIKSLFPNASNDECGAAAAGAFMAILSEREGGEVKFAYSNDGPFFRFPSFAARNYQ